MSRDVGSSVWGSTDAMAGKGGMNDRQGCRHSGRMSFRNSCPSQSHGLPGVDTLWPRSLGYRVWLVVVGIEQPVQIHGRIYTLLTST